MPVGKKAAPPLGCYVAQIGQIGDFARGYLPVVHAEGRELLDGFVVKRGAHEAHPLTSTLFGQPGKVGRGQFEPLEHSQLRVVVALAVTAVFLLIAGLGG